MSGWVGWLSRCGECRIYLYKNYYSVLSPFKDPLRPGARHIGSILHVSQFTGGYTKTKESKALLRQSQSLNGRKKSTSCPSR